MPTIKRRQFLRLSLQLPGIALTAPFLVSACSHQKNQLLISGYAHTDKSGNRLNKHGVLVFDSQRKIISDFDVPDEVHLACLSPDKKSILVCSRKPEASLLRYDLDGKLMASLSPLDNQHFEGHGIYSKDGQTLYVTASDYTNQQGRLLILNANTLELKTDISSGGIGPHELVWQSEDQIAIANTGVLTHPKSGRTILNKDTIQSNISLFNVNQEHLIKQWQVPLNGLSARHLDAMEDGSLVIGCQYKKEDQRPPCVAFLSMSKGLIFAEELNDSLHWNMKGYTASIKGIPNSNQALITNPRGHLVTRWQNTRDGQLLKSEPLKYAKGLTVSQDATTAWISQGPGKLLTFDLNDNQFEVSAVKIKEDIWWGNHMG